MELLQNVVDYGDAPSFFATGIRRVTLLSPHVVRITFVRADVRDDGTPEHRVTGHIDLDVSHVLAVNALIHDAVALLLPQALLAAQMPGSAATH